jgi:putative flippase GtrA
MIGARAVRLVRQAARYTVVGVLNVAIDITLLSILVRVTGSTSGAHVGVLAAVASLCAVANSYVWNCRWTFERRLEPRRQFVPFLIVQGISVVITGVVVACLTSVLADQDVTAYVRVYEAKAAAVMASGAWNFSALRWFVFRATRPPRAVDEGWRRVSGLG